MIGAGVSCLGRGRVRRRRSQWLDPGARSNRKRRRCTRYARAGTLTRMGQGPGQVGTAFSGRIGKRKLAVGSYRATIGAIDAAGNRAQTRQTSFSVVR